jgi:hypothetical protein
LENKGRIMKKTRAFPNITIEPGINEYSKTKVYDSGMTLRDYFAGQVISGHIYDGMPDTLAAYAYDIADSMLKRREAE